MAVFSTHTMNKHVKQSTYSRMEDVDRSCVHVVIIICVIFAILTYMIYPAGILDIAYAELTAGHVVRLTGAVILGVLTIRIFIDILDVFIKR